MRVGPPARAASGAGAEPAENWPMPPLPAAEFRTNPNVTVLVSLFLLLLAFFIVLSVSSLREQRPVTAPEGSRQSAAGSADLPTAGRPGLFREPVPERAVTAPDPHPEPLALLFETLRPHALPPPEGGGLVAVLPAEMLFPPGAAVLRPEAGALLAQVAATLRNPPAGTRYRLEATLGGAPLALLAESYLRGGGEDGPALDVARAGALARALAGSGAPSGSLTVALAAERAGELALDFRIEAGHAGD